jgi:hypothetical protein
MADSEEENTMEVEAKNDEPATEEFHDAATVLGGAGTDLTGEVKSDIHILLEITYRGSGEARKTPQKHLQVLYALAQEFNKSELKIYNQENKRVSRDSLEQWRDVRNYEDSFTINESRGRHYVVFRTSTTKKFGELKRAPIVWQTLRDT